MKLLVIGGSVFLGRAFVEEALNRGNEVTTFNRGQSGANLPGVEAIRGDREVDEDLRALVAGRQWDAVIDTCGFVPRQVARTAKALSGRAGTYAFVSSFHAYAGWPAERVDETTPRHECPSDAGPDHVVYNALKAGCERAVEDGFDGRTLILNPGLIVGPRENVGRLPWWLNRIARGGRVLAPGDPNRPMQLIDARDIARFGLDQLAAGRAGRFLTTGVVGNATFGDLLRACAAATGSDAELVWVEETFLLDQEAGPWTELPLWMPDAPAAAGTWLASSDKALAAGLSCRSVAETVQDTWKSLQAQELPAPKYLQGGVPIGMSPDKELRILAAWDARPAS
jgi:2'-hydroxyisoflavone reductase